MAKRNSRKKSLSKASYRSKSSNNGCLAGAAILFLVLILLNPVIIFGCLALTIIFFLWKIRRQEDTSDVIGFNILVGCLVYLILGVRSYANSERPDNERLLSFVHLDFSQEQYFLVYLSAFGILVLMPTILSVITINRRNHKNQRIREEQEKKRIEAEQEAQRLQEEYYKKLNEVFVSTNREDYVIGKEDYKRGNKRESEYRKKHILTLLNLYQNQCAKCRKSDNGFDLDHFFISKNEGGNFALAHRDGHLVNNAIPLCQSCNRSKGDRPYDAFFNNDEILSLFTKNRQMTLILNQVSSSDQLQLEIQGLLPGVIQPTNTTGENQSLSLTEFQFSSSESLSKTERLDSQVLPPKPMSAVDPEPSQLVDQCGLGQNLNDEDLSNDDPLARNDDMTELPNGRIPQVIISQYGFRTNFWSDKVTKKMWTKFTQSGPEYAMPIKRTACTSPFLDSPGSLYAGLYAKDKFDNLAHFQVYNLFTSSIQQILFQTGEVDMDWFGREDKDAGAKRFENWNRAILEFPQEPSIEECFAQVALPAAVQWVKDLHFHAWAFERREGIFEVQADCLEGYLTMFTVND